MPRCLPTDSPYHQAERDLRRRLVADTLVRAGGNRTQAARMLNVTTVTLRAWVVEFKLDPDVLGQYQRRELAARELGVENTGPRWTWLCPEAETLAASVTPPATWARIRDAYRRQRATEALATYGGDNALAAVALGLNSETVRRWGTGHQRARAGRSS